MKKFSYKVSIIIPVYNMEHSLAKTMESLFLQTMPQHLMEIILIDDGSEDGSSSLCDDYARGHSNVHVIHQDNSGVSAARNAGIYAAKGKYLLYLDGDDTLSPESVQNISDFFDMHYNEIDLVTYPLEYHYENGKTAGHWRYREYLTKTGIYSLEEYPYICQTTINICVKNCEENLFFDEEISLAEDQLYTTSLLSRTGKIGFVAEALYNYMRHATSNSYMKYPPYFSFDVYNTVHEGYLEIGINNQKMKHYCMNMILYDIAWRLSSGLLLPIYLKGREYEEALGTFSRILDHISNQEILSYPHMDNTYKWFLLSLKTRNRPFVCVDEKKISIVDNSGVIYDQNRIQLVMNQVSIKQNLLHFFGYINCFPLLYIKDIPRLFCVINNSISEEIPIIISQANNIIPRYLFQCFIPLEKVNIITLEVCIRRKRYPANLWYAKRTNINNSISCNYIKGNSFCANFFENRIEIKLSRDKEVKSGELLFEKKLFHEYKEQWFVRRIIIFCQKFDIWIYSDSHDSIDNGYYQFMHDFEKKDGVHRYYVYHQDNIGVIEEKFSFKHKSHLIPFGSYRHKCLFAAASKILVSFVGKSTYFPFPEKTRKYYANLFQYEVIYLQHGVMHARLTNMYSKEQVWQVDKIVASTRFEAENFLELGYRKEDILTSGMPRLDMLQLQETRQRRILFAPSWRKYLVNNVKGVGMPKKNFYDSEYYIEFCKFLNSDYLNQFLTKYDCYLDVQIHPMFNCYSSAFLQSDSERIRMVKSASLSDYLMCITDFSSIMFDFIYLNRPVVSFLPDRTLFEAGLHSYQDFYYPLENSFAIYCETMEQVMDALEELAGNNFKLPENQQKKADNLFFSREPNHAEQLYRLLKEGSSNGI